MTSCFLLPNDVNINHFVSKGAIQRISINRWRTNETSRAIKSNKDLWPAKWRSRGTNNVWQYCTGVPDVRGASVSQNCTNHGNLTCLTKQSCSFIQYYKTRNKASETKVNNQTSETKDITEFSFSAETRKQDEANNNEAAFWTLVDQTLLENKPSNNVKKRKKQQKFW